MSSVGSSRGQGWRRFAWALVAVGVGGGLLLGQEVLEPTRVVSLADTGESGLAEVAGGLEVFPLSPGMVFERYESGVGGQGGTAGVEKLIYSNTFGTFGAAAQAGSRWADDLATSSVPGALGANSACRLKRIEFPVLGRVDPLGVGGAYTVDFELFRSCPGSVSQTGLDAIRIPGSAGQAVFTDDGPHLISHTYVNSLAISNTVWLAVTFSRENAGMVVGSPAQQGFSCDRYDSIGAACNSNHGGFPQNPYAAFNVQLFGDVACNDAHVVYRANRPSGPPYNPGANIVLTDDIELDSPGCQMISYEVAVRGQGAYTFSLRNQCDSAPITGTQRTLNASGNDPRILRTFFDPPIAIPRNFSFAASVINAIGGVITSGEQACVGRTEDFYQVPAEGGGCTNITPMAGVHSAMNLTITCAGSAPVGACCDMYFTDANDDAVCREVPRMNCPWPPRFTDLQPSWIEAATCEPDPFPFPCGASACCRPDQACRDLTANECDRTLPEETPREWQRGQYCVIGDPLRAFGECSVARRGPGCGDPDCQDMVCGADRWCCDVEWDPVCVRAVDAFPCVSAAGDLCSDSESQAIAVDVNSSVVFGNTATYGTERDAHAFSCNRDGPNELGFHTVWFVFRALDTSVRLGTCDTVGAAADTMVSVYSADDSSTPSTACESLSEMVCDDDGCEGGLGSELCVTGLLPCTYYYIQVGTHAQDLQGVVELAIESPCPEEAGRIRSPVQRDEKRNVASRPRPVVVESDAGGQVQRGDATRLLTASTFSRREVMDDPPMARPDVAPAGAKSHCGPWVWNGYESIQVNAGPDGCNMLGDAANEPSIAVNPTNRQQIVIGWRQFDTVRSNFRQAGWGYTFNAGRAWTFPGTLDNGAWRSDPVLASDPDGNFRFYSIDYSFNGNLFTSYDGGRTWPRAVWAFGGDKPWMAIDQTEGIGRGNIYVVNGDWGFSRSTNDGATFSSSLSAAPYWGSVTVGIDGTVFVAGLGQVGRSRNARDPSASVSFDLWVSVPIGVIYGPYQNPGGLNGQIWVAADPLDYRRVYLLSPDARFLRGVNGGQTWTNPVALDRTSGAFAPWFAMLSVAPNGRIDAAWNDAAVGCETYGPCSQLFYTSSTDGGDTWAEPVSVAPPFDSRIGWPNQNKIGDYYHMVSDDAGVNIAYAATFNGEQDVYFLRIGPITPTFDCNANGVEDLEDVLSGTSEDCDHNFFPDECGPDFDGDGLVDLCDDDSDNDTILDAIDRCDRTPLGARIFSDGGPLSATTGQCSVTLSDYWRFRNCLLNGRSGFPAPAQACGARFDHDGDATLDLRDFAGFQNAFGVNGR